MLNCFDWKKITIFAGGVLFGTAGIKVLGSKDAKKRSDYAFNYRFY